MLNMIYIVHYSLIVGESINTLTQSYLRHKVCLKYHCVRNNYNYCVFTSFFRMVPDAVRKGYAMLQTYLAKQVEVSAFS